MSGGIGWKDPIGWKDGGIGWGTRENPVKPEEEIRDDESPAPREMRHLLSGDRGDDPLEQQEVRGRDVLPGTPELPGRGDCADADGGERDDRSVGGPHAGRGLDGITGPLCWPSFLDDCYREILERSRDFYRRYLEASGDGDLYGFDRYDDEEPPRYPDATGLLQHSLQRDAARGVFERVCADHGITSEFLREALAEAWGVKRGPYSGGEPDLDLNPFTIDYIRPKIGGIQGARQKGSGQDTAPEGELMATQAELDNWYSYHAPTHEQAKAYEHLRAKTKELAEVFDLYAPACADTTAAHRKLRDAVMAMNQAIACNGLRET